MTVQQLDKRHERIFIIFKTSTRFRSGTRIGYFTINTVGFKRVNKLLDMNPTAHSSLFYDQIQRVLFRRLTLTLNTDPIKTFQPSPNNTLNLTQFNGCIELMLIYSWLLSYCSAARSTPLHDTTLP